MTRALLLLIMTACGDDLAAPAGDGGAPGACTATYTGNLSETAVADTCVTLAGPLLTARIPSAQLDAPLVATFDLGTTDIVGTYTSATVATWIALGTRTVTQRACTYRAGSADAPHGDFTLTLDADRHGTLTLHTAVLADVFTDCGDPLLQKIELAF